jgi:hypothetical protein
MLAFLKAAKLKERAAAESRRKLTVAFGAIGMNCTRSFTVLFSRKQSRRVPKQ